MDGIDPEAAREGHPAYLKEASKVVNDRTTNWTIAPCPTPAWAELVHPELEPAVALERLWGEVEHACRLDQPDPVAAWRARGEQLTAIASRLDGLRLDSVRFDGRGTRLTVGLLGSSRWIAARQTTVEGISHYPNIPTEEVFTVPDPERVQGTVRATKPLSKLGSVIFGLEIRFEHGRAVRIDADQNADVLRALCEQHPDAARLGEVALVDRDSRVGALGHPFYQPLLDENAASHIALGNAFHVRRHRPPRPRPDQHQQAPPRLHDRLRPSHRHRRTARRHRDPAAAPGRLANLSRRGPVQARADLRE
jgi:aminopeptidase